MSDQRILIKELETLGAIGRTITASLDLDKVLTMVVDAAVDLTGAEEGSLLLVDENSGELYMRAARNFQDDFVRTFRIPINDTLAGQVIRSGSPVLIDESAPQKIKTSYLVSTLIYVPLKVHKRIIGVLGVDNRTAGESFLDHDIVLMSALADYAAIAIENASLYTNTEIERGKLESILTQIEEGVIVVDQQRRVILVNRIARGAFDLGDEELAGRPAQHVIKHTELLENLYDQSLKYPYQAEIPLEDGRVFNAQFTPISGIGLAVTMQDISHLKELDRIKSEFVSTVSHDLRSPLTAILGYVELIERAGPVNQQQHDFIRRVHFNVNSITALINDLLDLGRIEAGLDARKELVPIPAIIRYAIDGLQELVQEKAQVLEIDLAEELPPVRGNPVHLRQVVGNLIGNAVKYTGHGGMIHIHAREEDGLIMLQVKDTGPGIPPSEQPYVFDKFYRGRAVPPDTPGTGLGLAIVKSVVENHQGRVWVESQVGSGSTFTVVLPVAEQEAVTD
ncbi:MAG TPA: ATP-binding protein [Anaerolineales bacterium]|nr:ATP-binding protein [Anaerolineales bacterium]